jgi:hypothetical protein
VCVESPVDHGVDALFHMPAQDRVATPGGELRCQGMTASRSSSTQQEAGHSFWLKFRPIPVA